MSSEFFALLIQFPFAKIFLVGDHRLPSPIHSSVLLFFYLVLPPREQVAFRKHFNISVFRNILRWRYHRYKGPFWPNGEIAMSGTNTRNTAISISLLLLAAIGFAASPAPARTPSPQTVYSGPGRYEIENVASGKVLDLNRQDQRTIVQWPRNHSQSQQWDIEDAGNGYVYVKSALTGLAMDIDGGRARDGARIITSQASGSDSQLWKIEGKGGERRFTSRLSISLDLPHGSRDDGVEYQVWSGAGQDNQRFRLVWISASVPPNRNNRGEERMMTEEKRSYDRGYHFGSEDFRARLRRSYARHRGDYNPQWEEAFIDGYYDGYDSARPDTNVMRSEEKDSYDAAYRLGQKDYREGKEPSYMRYADRFDPRSEPFFRRGYADGYYSSR